MKSRVNSAEGKGTQELHIMTILNIRAGSGRTCSNVSLIKESKNWNCFNFACFCVHKTLEILPFSFYMMVIRYYTSGGNVLVTT